MPENRKKAWNLIFAVGSTEDRGGQAFANQHAAPGTTSSFRTLNCLFMFLLFLFCRRSARTSFGKLAVDHEKTAFGLTHQF